MRRFGYIFVGAVAGIAFVYSAPAPIVKIAGAISQRGGNVPFCKSLPPSQRDDCWDMVCTSEWDVSRMDYKMRAADGGVWIEYDFDPRFCTEDLVGHVNCWRPVGPSK